MYKQIKLTLLACLGISQFAHAATLASPSVSLQKAAENPAIIYVEHKQINKITAYAIDPETGDLTRIDKNNIDTRPVPGDVAISGRHVYVIHDITPYVRIYNIENDGTLTIAKDVLTGSGPWSTKITPLINGKTYAYCSNYDENTVSMFSLNKDNGILEAQSPPKIPVSAYGPAGIGINPQNPHFAYIVNFDSDRISLFTINQTTGQLYDEHQSFKTGVKPRGITFDLSNHAYTNDFSSSSISMHQMNAETGSLEPLRVKSVHTGPEPMAMSFDSSKQFFYVTSKAENRIYMFKKESDGVLVPQNPPYINSAGIAPRSIAVNKNHLYVSNMLSNNMVKFDINQNGTLSNPKSLATAMDPEVMDIYVPPHTNTTRFPSAGRLPW